MIKMITSNILANNNNNLNSPHSQSQHNDSGFDSGSSPELFHNHHSGTGMGVVERRIQQLGDRGNQHLNHLNQDEAPMSRTAQYRKVSF